MTIPARLLVFIYAFVMLFKGNERFTCFEIEDSKFENKDKAKDLIGDYLTFKHCCSCISTMFYTKYGKCRTDHPIHFKFFRMMTLIKISMS